MTPTGWLAVAVAAACGGVVFGRVASAEVPGLRVEAGDTRYLAGSHTFSNMVIHGTLLLTGDTVVTLVGPPIVETGVLSGQVLFIRSTGRIGNDPHPGTAGPTGATSPFSAGPGGTSGRDANPDDPLDRPGDGTSGQRGYDGGMGGSAGDGWSAPSLTILADGGGVQLVGRIQLLGSNGGRGGSGGDATQGGGGGNGGYSKHGVDGTGGNGGPGGDGGNGGHGGNGGPGGTLRIVARGRVMLQADIDVSAGNGGWGGGAGRAGAGGTGGSGGYLAQLFGGPGDGVPGRGGNAGHSGLPGSGGDGGRGGTIDIYSSEDIQHTGKPRRLMAHGGRGGDRGSRGGGGASGGSGGAMPNNERGPAGEGVNEPDVGGGVGRAGAGGMVRLTSRGSIKPAVEGQGYVLQALAVGGEGGYPGDPGYVSRTVNGWLTAEAGRLPGGDGGPGGEVEVKARGSAQLTAYLRGGNGNRGARGQGIAGVASARGARGGDGGDGGRVEIIAPTIRVDPNIDLDLAGGAAGPGGYPGDAGASGPTGEFGPAGSPGSVGRSRLVLAVPALFPRTSHLEVTSKPTDKAPVGKVIRLRYEFLNDDPEARIENLRLVATWPTPFAEPLAADLGASRSGQGLIAFPPDLPSGAKLTWNLEFRVPPPFISGARIPTEIRIAGDLVGSPGDDSATLTLPMAPREDLWFDIVPDRGCMLPGGEMGFTVRWQNTSAEDPLTQVRIQLDTLPVGVHQVAGASVWNPGPVGPGASGAEHFTVWAASPWNESWGRHFTVNASASAAELDGVSRLDSVHDVWLGKLGLEVSRPTAALRVRGNRVGSAGAVADCSGALKPGDVSVVFVTEGVDADTGQRLERRNSPVPLQAGLAFDTEDAARVVAVDNILTAQAKTAGDSAEVGPLSADSVFFEVTHGILAGGVPRLAEHGLPDSGQAAMLRQWKQSYPEVAEDVALRRTDGVERLDVINDLGVIAQTVAEAHYPEIAEGAEGVLSVWDLAYLYSLGASKQALLGNRVLGLLGTKASRLGALTSASSEMLVNSALPGIGKRLGLASRIEHKAMDAFLSQYGDDVVNQTLLLAQWQLGSGKMLKLALRNLNSPTQLQNDPAYYVGGVYPVELPVDPAVHGAMETLLRLLVEPFTHGSVAMGQERCLGLSFGGSQDLALATGENAKDVLQTMSGITLRWGDLHDAVHDVSVAARESLMWMEMIPVPALQKVAGKAFYVADAVGRIGAGLKVSDHAHFLQALAAITTAGVESVVEGNLDAFGYPITRTAPALTALPPGPAAARLAGVAEDPATAAVALYRRLDAAVRTGDTNALPDLAEALAPLHDALAERENLLATRAGLLVPPPSRLIDDTATVAALAAELQSATAAQAWRRLALVQGAFAWFLGPDTTLGSNLLATLTALESSQLELERLAESTRARLDRISLPDVPTVVRIHAPLAVEGDPTNTISVVVANVGTSVVVEGTLTLLTPAEDWGELRSPAVQSVRTLDGRARAEWTIVPRHPGTFADGFAIRLDAADGRPLEAHSLVLSVEEGAGRQTLDAATGGSIRSALGSATLEVPPGGFTLTPGVPALQSAPAVEVFLLPVSSAVPGEGFVPVGESAVQVLALGTADRRPVNPSPGRCRLTLAWDDDARPVDADPAGFRVFMAEAPGRWTVLESRVDVAAHTVQAALPRAGWFMLGWLDASIPAPPTDPVAEARTDGLRLRWTASPSTDVAGYVVIGRTEDGSRIESVQRVPSPDQHHLDLRSAPRGVRRRYSVLAIDAAGHASSESTAILGVWPPDAAIESPRLSALLEGGVLVLEWTATVTGFRLEVTRSPGTWSWTSVSDQPVAANGRWRVTRPIAQAAELFRLARP